MHIELTEALKAELSGLGVDTLWGAGGVTLPVGCQFEPPCSIKWMQLEHSLRLGAFSYAVSGYFGACVIGRYVSIGENIQAGRGDHPTDWLSTSPFQYLDAASVFGVSEDYDHADKLHFLGCAGAPPLRAPTQVLPIHIGHDVWIGHGAYLRPGIRIGNGAIVAANAVVTRDVPAYAVVAGNPARVKRMRFNDAIVGRLEASCWWQYALWDLKGIAFDVVEQALDQIEERVSSGSMEPYAPVPVDLGQLGHVGR